MAVSNSDSELEGWVAEDYKNSANAEYKNQSYRKAIDLYTIAIKMDDTVPAYFTNRAASFLMVKDFKSALADCNSAIKIDQTNSKAYYRAGKATLSMGKSQQAHDFFTKALRLDGKNPTLLKDIKALGMYMKSVQMGHSALESQDYRLAVFNYDKAIEIATGDMATRYKRLEGLLGQKKYEVVCNDAAALLRENQTDAEAMYIRGLALYYQGNSDSALSHLVQCLKSYPDHAKAREFRKIIKQVDTSKKAGNEAYKAGKYEEAYALYTSAIEVDASNNFTNSRLYSNRAAVSQQQRKFKEAIEDCTKAIDLDAGFVKAYTRRAKCYLGSEQYDDAVKDLEKAASMDENNREIQQQLKNAKFELKKSKRKNYYAILNVEKDATETQIKKAYRKEALKWHPDKNQDNIEAADIKFKDVGEAYKILSDPQQRHRYDSGADLEEEGGFGGGGMHGMDMNDIFRMFGGGGMGGMGGMGGGFSFQEMGGGRRGGGHSHGGHGGHGHSHPFHGR
eukprot:CFRG0388T1